MKNDAKLSVVVSDNVTKKTYNYSKADVKVEFVVRIDIKQQMKDLKDCLERCIKEIDVDLAKLD